MYTFIVTKWYLTISVTIVSCNIQRQFLIMFCLQVVPLHMEISLLYTRQQVYPYLLKNAKYVQSPPTTPTMWRYHGLIQDQGRIMSSSCDWECVQQCIIVIKKAMTITSLISLSKILSIAALPPNHYAYIIVITKKTNNLPLTVCRERETHKTSCLVHMR